MNDETGISRIAAMANHVAHASMLIRRPVADVFGAFVNPDTITKFWLESTTGPLGRGAQVRWAFMVPGATETVTVIAFEDNRRIAFDWSDGNRVNMVFEARGNGATRLAVEVTGLQNESAAVNATEGFSIVLCDLKTLLESGRSANLVRDKAELIAAS
jgi:uncharacterized protein YndB with AHSA1/START domain